MNLSRVLATDMEAERALKSSISMQRYLMYFMLCVNVNVDVLLLINGEFSILPVH
jgi:hypothetical protein